MTNSYYSGGCDCIKNEILGKNHIKYTGEIILKENGTVWGRFTCPHGGDWTKKVKGFVSDES
jgi:hypothetical protein